MTRTAAPQFERLGANLAHGLTKILECPNIEKNTFVLLSLLMLSILPRHVLGAARCTREAMRYP